MILATGALHEDGLADVADGFGGGQTKADKLRIMRDSRLGTYGTLALVITLLIRISAVVALEDLWIVVPALITAAALSRAAMPVAMTVMAPARDEGLAAKAGRPHRGRVVLAAVIAALLACLCVPWVQVFFVLVAAFTVTAAFMLIVKRQIDGVTGDTIGALQQIVEIAILVTLVSQKSLV
jgi:adenosylcobinamide-GDP ribazoletransferase